MRRSVFALAAVCALVAAFAATPAATAQTTTHPRAIERLTFTVPDASKAELGNQRLELTINRWSSEGEREHLLNVLDQDGPNRLPEAIASDAAVGYLHWPGNLDYTLRYAFRTPRPEGGEDIVVATDSPVHLWWEPNAPI